MIRDRLSYGSSLVSDIYCVPHKERHAEGTPISDAEGNLAQERIIHLKDKRGHRTPVLEAKKECEQCEIRPNGRE
jgi:hypothetical protein